MIGRHTRVIVIGAGMGGLTAAAALSRAGYEVQVFERARELRPTGTGLSLMSNALQALDEVGIRPNFDGRAVVFESLAFRTRKGKLIRRMEFGRIAEALGQPNLAIHRASLQQALLEQASDCAITLSSTVTRYERTPTGVAVEFTDGRRVEGDVLIGADGFNSVVRRQLLGDEPPRYAGYVCWRATPHFTHPVVTPAYAAHYWGRGQRFGLADIGDGRVYWWGTLNMSEAQARAERNSKPALLQRFAGWADEVQAVIEATPEETISSLPEFDRPFADRWGEGPVTLLGDAAHPMVSSLGQGAAIAIEDGVVLAQCLRSAADVEQGLRTYEARRLQRTRMMVEAARALSRTEQLANPLKTLGRGLYFRYAPERVFEERNQASLAFQGAPA